MAALNISIRTGDTRAIFKQIVDGIGIAIASGKLKPGDKLPSVRALGTQLNINPNTVAKAYAELTNQGLVDAMQGLGLFVAEPKQMLSNAERQKRLGAAVRRCVNDVVHLQYSDQEILRTMATELQAVRGNGKARSA